MLKESYQYKTMIFGAALANAKGERATDIVNNAEAIYNEVYRRHIELQEKEELIKAAKKKKRKWDELLVDAWWEHPGKFILGGTIILLAFAFGVTAIIQHSYPH